ncbi:MAG: DUF3147 family protein [Candidatus Dormibacteraeota bacterium]|nr:DUF3147 family protein [Candidatus Dormibacteraeota bacterium]MBO0743478.1 DUF3147 family protein [Candidatus Dormibacteraeota bacterium]
MSEPDRPEVEGRSLRSIRPCEYVIRFTFGAAVALVAAVVGEVAGLHAGGLLLAFPAILPATLALIEKKEDRRRAREDDIGTVAGGVGMVAFALVGWLVLTRVNAGGPATLGAAFLAWAVVSIAPFVAVAGRRVLRGRREEVRGKVGRSGRS